MSLALDKQASRQLLKLVYGTVGTGTVTGILNCDTANPLSLAAPRIPREPEPDKVGTRNYVAIIGSYTQDQFFRVSKLSSTPPPKKRKRKRKEKGMGGWERKKKLVKDCDVETQASRSTDVSANNLLRQKEVVIIVLMTLIMTT